ncbi:histidine--tRNA ligase [Patescibacteria group bacterium]|nr:histidine--tRNA ligase [Patescibacteria group bacterium]
MNPIQSPRGTRDILPDRQPAWQYVTETARQTAGQLSFRPITIPSYEEAALFHRSIGDGTDIIDKELFLTRGIRSTEEETYALRPEATAGVVRAFIQHGMHTWPQPVRLYTILNVFRYDRPQKGRYREHTQFDVEYFGDTGPFADAWVIFTTWSFLNRLGLSGLELQLNTLGTSVERSRYAAQLQEYFRPLRDRISEDSVARLEKNPLRILDSKDPRDKEFMDAAPRLSEALGPESQAHFDAVRQYLEKWRIPYRLNEQLVRGLDYYSHTAFEWTVSGQEGQQSSLGGGGRYDGLLPQLGGSTVGAVGAGLGLDRIIETCEQQGVFDRLTQHRPDAYLVAADTAGKTAVIELIPELIAAGLSVDAGLDKDSVGAQMKAAAKSQSRWAVIIGATEAERGEVAVKDLESSEQRTVSQAELVSFLRDA